MNLDALSEEIRTALDSITGLRVVPWGVERVTPPAAIVSVPDRISYDETYGRGKDAYQDLAVIVLGGRPADRSTIKRLAGYLAGSGAGSVKAALEAHAWVECEVLDVNWAEVDVVKYADNPYLAAIFHLDIIGKGA